MILSGLRNTHNFHILPLNLHCCVFNVAQCSFNSVNFLFHLHRLRNKFLQLTLISLDSASWELHQCPCSPTILQNVLCLIFQIFLDLEAFECNTTSDWLKRTV